MGVYCKMNINVQQYRRGNECIIEKELHYCTEAYELRVGCWESKQCERDLIRKGIEAEVENAAQACCDDMVQIYYFNFSFKIPLSICHVLRCFKSKHIGSSSS